MLVYLLKLDNKKDLTYGLYMFLTQLCGLIKFLCFLYKNIEFQQLIKRSKVFQLETEFEERLIEKRIGFFFKIAVFYYIMAMIAIHTTELMAICAETVKLPFSAWYPFLDWEHNARDYWVAVAYQHVSITSASLLIITIDVLFSLLLFVVSIELELIGLRMSQIGYIADDNAICWAQQFEIFKNNINLHRKAVEFKCALEKCFDLPFFIQIVASGIVISSIINEVAHVNLKAKKKFCFSS